MDTSSSSSEDYIGDPELKFFDTSCSASTATFLRRQRAVAERDRVYAVMHRPHPS